MGCGLHKYVPKIARRPLTLNNSVRTDGLYFDITAIMIETKKKNIISIINYIDILVQRLQPTTFIFIAEEGTAPLQKIKMKNKIGKRDVGALFFEKLERKLNVFKQAVLNKIETDIAWQRPKVIISSYHTPGEAEQKIFNFIKLFHQKNSNMENFVHTIVSVDSDCLSLVLANKLRNTFLITNLDGSKKLDESVISNKNGKIPLSMVPPSDLHIISLTIFAEYIYNLMRGTTPRNDEDLLNVSRDFAFLYTLHGDDYIPGLGLKFASIKYYKNVVPKGQYIINEEGGRITINNRLLAKFIKNCGVILKRFSTLKEANMVYDAVVWAFLNSTTQYLDYGYLFPINPIKGEVSIADFLLDKENLGYFPSFNFEKTELLSPYLFYAVWCGINILPESIKKHIDRKNYTPDNPDIAKIKNIINEHIKECTVEEQSYNKIQKPYLFRKIEPTPFEIRDFAVDIVPEKRYIPSLKYFPVQFSFSNGILIVKANDEPIPEMDFFVNLIGKNVYHSWPNIRPGIIHRVIYDSTLIDENRRKVRIPKDYIKFESFKKTYSETKGIDFTDQRVFLLVKPFTKQSPSREFYELETRLRVIPFCLAITEGKYQGIEYPPFLEHPVEKSCSINVGDSVCIKSKRSHGFVEKIENGKCMIKYTKFGVPILPKNTSDLSGYVGINDKGLKNLLKVESAREIIFRIESMGLSMDALRYEEKNTKIPISYIFPLFTNEKGELPSKVVIKKDIILSNTYSDEELQDYIKNIKIVEESSNSYDVHDVLFSGMEFAELNIGRPTVNSRVAFIGLSSSTPFGSIGTVYEARPWRNEYMVILDETNEYAHDLNGKIPDKRIISASGGDLFIFA